MYSHCFQDKKLIYILYIYRLYIYMQSWKQCALPVIATMAFRHLMHLGTWCRVVLLQSHCRDNREGTLFSWLHLYYAHLDFVRFEHSVCPGSKMNFRCCGSIWNVRWAIWTLALNQILHPYIVNYYHRSKVTYTIWFDQSISNQLEVTFRKKLADNINNIKSSENLLIFAGKTTNLY